MQGNEQNSYHVNNSRVTSARSDLSLITIERSQKLDLLIHLISNLRQSLLICGAEGIGKTTLLNELERLKKELWFMVKIQASPNLSFESFQYELSRFLQQNYAEYKNLELPSILASTDKRNQKIVVIIDDAGKLVPGLISNLIQYAAASSCLRIVFALTHDELYIKNRSDREIDDCHFIEIPPLTERQCGQFLQQLSGQSGAIVSFNAINDRLVDKLYRETHGIPGKIISELPKLSSYKAAGHNKWLGVALISTIVAIGSSFFIADKPVKRSEPEDIKTPLVLQKAEDVEIYSPVIQAKIKDNISVEPTQQTDEDRDTNIVPVQTDTNIEGNKSPVFDGIEKANNEIDSKHRQSLKEDLFVQEIGIKDETNGKPQRNSRETVAEVTDTEKVIDIPIIEQKQSEAEEKKTDRSSEQNIQTEKKGVAEIDDNRWVLAQPEKNYTIQLMVLSRRESVLDFLKKNKSLKESFRFYHTDKKGQKKYVFIYGSFKNSAIAVKKMKSLPIKYRKSWVRKFEILQKDITQ